MGYLDGFLVTLKQHRIFGGERVTTPYSGGRVAKKGKSVEGRDEKINKPERLHGRHVLNRYEDGMEKCIGCELCAGVCPAKCIYVRGADNDPQEPTSPGERFGFVYEINYLRCIHCDLCVEACPTEAITESKLFEFSFTSRSDAVYTKNELLVGDDGKPKQMPWEDWRAGEDLLTSGWMRATSPSGDANFVGAVGWSGELGYGVRPSEPVQAEADAAAGREDGEVGGPMMELIVFVAAGAMVLGGAVGVILSKHPVHAALSLILTLFGVAVLFIAQQANFLAAVQVIVYAGAIVVLFLFVIMLLGVDNSENLQIEPFKLQRPAAAVVGAGLFGLITTAAIVARDAETTVKGDGLEVTGPDGGALHDGNIKALARDLFSDHVLAFELTSVLLVIAVVGTVLLARKPRKGEIMVDQDSNAGAQ